MQAQFACVDDALRLVPLEESLTAKPEVSRSRHFDSTRTKNRDVASRDSATETELLAVLRQVGDALRREEEIKGRTNRSTNHHKGLVPIQGRTQPPDTVLAYSVIAIAKTKKIGTLTQVM